MHAISLLLNFAINFFLQFTIAVLCLQTEYLVYLCIMETLIVRNASREDLDLLLNIAQKMGMKVSVAPQPDKKKLMGLAKTIKKNATKKAFEKLGLDYDCNNR